MAVRIVASRAGDLALHKTLRALERLDDESRLAEPPILIKALSGELVEGNALVAS